MSQSPELLWMREAKRHLGMHEIKHNFILKDWLKDLNVEWLGNNPAWCGIYVARVFKVCGMPYPKDFYRAASYRNFGSQLNRPAYGCLAIKSRKGGDHVCFVVGKTKEDKLIVIGGNQSDQVCYATYKESDFDCFVWCGKTSRPADHRYNLEILSIKSKTAVSED